MSEQQQDSTTTTTAEAGGPDRFRWEVEAEIIAPQGVNLEPVVKAFTDLQVCSLHARTDLLRPTGAGAMCQRWERALRWSEELPDFGRVEEGLQIATFDAMVAVTLHCPDGRTVPLTGGQHERVVFGRGAWRHYHRLEHEDKGELALHSCQPTGHPEHPYLDVWAWRPRGVPQPTRRVLTPTNPEAGGPDRFRWEVEAEIIAPQGVNLDPLVQAFTALQARSLQGPTRSLKPNGEKYLGERLEQALYSAGPWPDFGRDKDGRRIIAFEGTYNIVLRAPDGAETYIGGLKSEWWNRCFGLKQRVGLYFDLERAGEGRIERRFGWPNIDSEYRFPFWVWNPDLEIEWERDEWG